MLYVWMNLFSLAYFDYYSKVQLFIEKREMLKKKNYTIKQSIMCVLASVYTHSYITYTYSKEQTRIMTTNYIHVPKAI